GDTTVSVTVTDKAGNTSAPCTFTITILDRTAPVKNLGALATIETECSAAIPAPPHATDLVSLDITGTTPDAMSYTKAFNGVNADAFFPKGDTTLTYSVTDGSGNTTTRTRKVTVIDNETPKIAAPADITVRGTLPAGTFIAYAPVVSDNCDVPPFIDVVSVTR